MLSEKCLDFKYVFFFFFKNYLSLLGITISIIEILRIYVHICFN